MNINYYFSIQDQLFNIGFEGQEIDESYTQVDKETYDLFFEKVSAGCLVLSIENKRLSPAKPSNSHTWNGVGWVESRTPEQIEESKLKSLTSLTRRQFRRVLVQNGYDLDVIKAKILEIEDTQTRQLTLIDWEDADTFERLDTSLIMMAEMMGMSDDQVNAMWEQALTI